MTMRPLNILLVDDKPENLLALEQLLRQPDRQIFKAGSGNEALKLLLKHDFAVVLLDVEMPEMDGYETAQLMRSEQRTRAVPIIFVTAGDHSEQRTFRGYEVGAVDFLQKPVNAQILKSKVGVFAELHRKSEDLKAVNGALERATTALREKVVDLENVNRTLSHDLRAPLRSISSFSALLAESLKGKLDAEAEDYMGRILRACARMGKMLDDLFALLRLSAAEQALADLDTQAVLAEVLDSLRSDIEQTGTVVTHDPLPHARANATLFAQVLQNLIANAIKFCGPNPPRIHVGVDELNAGWRFYVRDQGLGIEAAARERIFGLFERLGSDTVPGSGVGLALCKRAVEKHGGRIWVESTPGQGSTFYFTIPRAEPREPRVPRIS